MFRRSGYSRSFAIALIFVALSAVEAMAHCFVGARFLPATLATDDPCVADEISLPTVSWSKTADMPPATEWDVSVDFAKRITEDFGISIGQTWTQIHQPGGFTAAGFGNLETTAQYQLLKNSEHELALLLGLIVEWGGTGAVISGLADPWSTLTPTFYFGKGLGDLPNFSDGGAPSLLPGRSATRFRPALSTSWPARPFRRCWFMVDRFSTACPI